MFVRETLPYGTDKSSPAALRVVEDTLRQLVKASPPGTSQSTGPPRRLRPPVGRSPRASYGSAPGTGEWGVETWIHPGAAAQPRPGNCLGGPGGRFGCQSSTAARPLLCEGQLMAGTDGNPEVLEMPRNGTLRRCPKASCSQPAHRRVVRPPTA
ncbi:hypothetical protein GCM10009544_01960 [Streptomyces stramineus]|uniref:Uncharacterized protein n=1 Tax=Streptomyces stramineus TaxID=173861 RepID=A0ABN0ZD20_9ACTN